MTTPYRGDIRSGPVPAARRSGFLACPGCPTDSERVQAEIHGTPADLCPTHDSRAHRARRTADVIAQYRAAADHLADVIHTVRQRWADDDDAAIEATAATDHARWLEHLEPLAQDLARATGATNPNP